MAINMFGGMPLGWLSQRAPAVAGFRPQMLAGQGLQQLLQRARLGALPVQQPRPQAGRALLEQLLLGRSGGGRRKQHPFTEGPLTGGVAAPAHRPPVDPGFTVRPDDLPSWPHAVRPTPSSPTWGGVGKQSFADPQSERLQSAIAATRRSIMGAGG
jgi:hypothetical protein